MQRTRPFPFRVVVRSDPAPAQDLPPAALAIVAQAQALLTRHAEDGSCAVIDLRCLRGLPGAREALQALLGEGSASATVAALGSSVLRETAVPCLWWVRHLDVDGHVKAEMLEVAEIPEILRSDANDIARGLAALQARTQALARAATDHCCTVTER